MKPLLLLLCLAACAGAQTVLTTDFDSTLPASIDPGAATLTPVQGYAGLGPAGNQFGGSFLRSPTGNTVKITLTNLPAHQAVNIAFLLAAIDSLDGTGTFPSGDYFHITLDGVTIFRESLANATASQYQSYVPVDGATLARRQDLGFSGPGSYYTDSAYNFGLEPRMQHIAHSASTLTLELLIEGQGIQDLNDESWAMDNLNITLDATANQTGQPGIVFQQVTFPVGPVPYFACLVQGAVPEATATLQASSDLGITDPWADLATATVNANGAVSFTDVPDPSASGLPRNFYRVSFVLPP